jgi:hypothetical protein
VSKCCTFGVKYGTLLMSARQVDYRTNEGTKMYTVDNLHPSVVADLKAAAQVELDRVWVLLTEATEAHKNYIGKMGETFAYDSAMAIYAQYETIKNAYRAIGLTGSIGTHRINN